MKTFANNLIVIPVHLPWEWSADYYNQTARIVGKHNIVYCFLWSEALSIKELLSKRKKITLITRTDMVLFFHPVHILPFRRYKTIQKINLLLNFVILLFLIKFRHRKKHIQQKFLWMFFPIFFPLLAILPKDWKTLYDCVDYVQNDNLRNNEEKQLIDHTAHMFVNSHSLHALHKNLKNNIHIAPQGFRLDVFENPKPTTVQFPTDKPIIGYIGGINNRLDFELLTTLIPKYPQWNFVFWGPIQIESEVETAQIRRLMSYPNVIRGSSPKDETPNIIKQFNIGIIPYDTKNLFNKHCFPMKLMEYFYLGKPVVSTNIIEVSRYHDLVFVARDTSEFIQHIQYILTHGWERTNQKRQTMIAKRNSWDSKIQAITHYIMLYS